MTTTKVRELTIDGMKCDSCELFMEKTLEKQLGVVSVIANAKTQRVKVTMVENTNEEDLKRKLSDQIEKQGYKIVDTIAIDSAKTAKQIWSLILAVLIFFLIFLLQKLNITSVFSVEELTYPAIFFLGVFASLSTCMAVVGGLSLTLSSKFAAEQKNKATVVFHMARLLGFIILGGIIGILGKVIIVTSTVSAILKLFVAFAMGIVGLDLLGVRIPKLVLPKSITSALGIFEDKSGWTNAVLLGVATFFLPCAFTQTMQLYAVSTGSFITGALVMGTFALGTLPVLSLVSIGAASGISKVNKGIFGYTMGYLIVLFALLNLLGALGTFGILPQFLLY